LRVLIDGINVSDKMELQPVCDGPINYWDCSGGGGTFPLDPAIALLPGGGGGPSAKPARRCRR
jgi:hypothetical protein